MTNLLLTSLLMLLTLTLITGVIYPLTVTGIAQGFFPHQANGSLIAIDNHALGSEWIGQPFSDPKYFWGRLSATGGVPYDAAASSGSNYGPMHNALKSAAETRITALTVDGTSKNVVPVDIVTSSGSGLDPHISPAAAEFQVARVAKARAMTEDQVRTLIAVHSHGRQFGILGEPRVHVLRLNLALDQLQGRK